MDGMLDNRAIGRKIRGLLIPVALENFLQILANIVTTSMVGRLPALEIAAQGVGYRLYNTWFALFRGIGIGLVVIVAYHYGAARPERCRRAVEQAYLTAVPFAGAIALACSLLPGPIVGLLAGDAALHAAAVSYLRIVIWAIPFAAMNALNTAAMNGHGNTRTPMAIAGLMNIFNIVVSYAFVFGLGPIRGWGLTGAAAATILSQAFGCLLGLRALYGAHGPFHNTPRAQVFFSLDAPEIKNLYATGIPAALENLFWQFSALLISRVILGYGSDQYAAYQLGLQAELLAEMPAQGFVVAASTLAASAIAMQNGALYKAYFHRLMKFAVLVGLTTSAILLPFPGPIMSVLTSNPGLQAMGRLYLVTMGFCQFPQVLSKVLNGTIRAAGSKRVPMYIAFVGIWVIRVPCIMLIGWGLGWGIVWIWGVIVVDQITRMLMSLRYVRRRRLYTYEPPLAEAVEI